MCLPRLLSVAKDALLQPWLFRISLWLGYLAFTEWFVGRASAKLVARLKLSPAHVPKGDFFCTCFCGKVQRDDDKECSLIGTMLQLHGKRRRSRAVAQPRLCYGHDVPEPLGPSSNVKVEAIICHVAWLPPGEDLLKAEGLPKPIAGAHQHPSRIHASACCYDQAMATDESMCLGNRYISKCLVLQKLPSR